jgi:hypothetical protein
MTLAEAIDERESLLKTIAMVEQERKQEWCGTLIVPRLQQLREQLNTLNSEILIAQQTPKR